MSKRPNKFKSLLNEDTPCAPVDEAEAADRRKAGVARHRVLDKDGPSQEDAALSSSERDRLKKIAIDFTSRRSTVESGAGNPPLPRSPTIEYRRMQDQIVALESISRDFRSSYREKVDAILEEQAGKTFASSEIKEIKVTVDGNGKLLDVNISDDLWRMKPVRVIEELLLSAINEARSLATGEWLSTFGNDFAETRETEGPGRGTK